MLETFKDFESPYISFFHIREPDEIEEFKNLLISKHTKLFTLLILRDNIESFNNQVLSNHARPKPIVIIFPVLAFTENAVATKATIKRNCFIFTMDF